MASLTASSDSSSSAGASENVTKCNLHEQCTEYSDDSSDQFIFLITVCCLCTPFVYLQRVYPERNKYPFIKAWNYKSVYM